MRLLNSSYRGELTLVSLKNFCQNALEVNQLEDEIMHRMAIELIRFAFNRDFVHRGDATKPSDEYADRDAALEIIELFNIRTPEVIEPAKNYVFKILRNPDGQDSDGEIKGPEFSKVVAWLAKDPNLKEELIDRTKKLWKNVTEPRYIQFYNGVLNSLRR